MNKWIKRGAGAAVGLVALAAATLVGAAMLGDRKAQRRVAVE